MLDAITASGAEVVTVSIRRISLEGYAESMVDMLGSDYVLLPNTAGCSTAREAVLTAKLAREALQTNWIKLEVIGDRETLHPDVIELLKGDRGTGSRRLHRPALLQRRPGVLPQAGRRRRRRRDAARLTDRLRHGHRQPARDRVDLLPAFGPGHPGRRHRHRIGRHAGPGTRMQRRLLNTAVAKARDPRRMAAAMRSAVEAGLAAREAGRIPKRTYAEPSSPQLA